MYVCVCKGVTDGQIKTAVDEGARSMRDVSRALGVTTVCGKCGPCAREILRERLHDHAVVERERAACMQPALSAA